MQYPSEVEYAVAIWYNIPLVYLTNCTILKRRKILSAKMTHVTTKSTETENICGHGSRSRISNVFLLLNSHPAPSLVSRRHSRLNINLKIILVKGTRPSLNT